MSRLSAILDQQFRLAAGIVGAVLMGIGFALVYVPLALIVPGGLLLTLAVAGALRETAGARR